jgi:hypothetical protein
VTDLAREHDLRRQQVCSTTGRDPRQLKDAIGAVFPQLANRYRASSAIENLNSVQKHAEQGFLNLFQFYWNMRGRNSGPSENGRRCASLFHPARDSVV